jgi:transcriptional regulator with XRE-family HTH domain
VLGATIRIKPIQLSRHVACPQFTQPSRFGTKLLEGAHVGNDIDLHLGKRLRRRRRLLGLTQQQLAATVGVRFQQIQKYECGANRISAARLWRIAEALDVEIGYFYEGLADAAPTPAPAPRPAEDAADLVRTYQQLGARRRQRVLALARSLHREDTAA